MTKGYFFTIEGGEGAGKSSLMKMMNDHLQAKGLEVVMSREPGGIAIAEQIRSVILDRKHTAMDGRTEALLYAAARRQHYVELIEPAIAQGKTVLCDRFIDSSLAYQGWARGLGIERILQINEFAINDVWPDMTIYLDLDPELGLRRIHEQSQHSEGQSQREINRLDLESLAFHRKVREGYLHLLQRFPERIKKIDAHLPIEAVHDHVKRVCDLFFAP